MKVKSNGHLATLTENIESQSDDNGPFYTSQRWIMAYMGFVFGVFLYALRVNVSIAIVCMVKSSTGEEVLGVGNFSYSLNNNTTNYPEITTDIPTGVVVCEEEADPGAKYQTGEFEWSKQTQSWVLSSFYYGCTVTQVFGGWIAKRFGGKRVIGLSMLVSAVVTLLTPALTRVSVIATIIIRVLLGCCAGMSIPAWFAMIGVWSPVYERSRMTAILWTGQVFGTILTYASSGFLCSHGFDNGWGSIFYIHGILTIVFVALWQYLTASSPAEHPRITEAERLYLQREVPPQSKEEKRQNIPWVKILTSVPVWSVFICHICSTWTFYTLLTCLPLYLKDVLKFNIQSNGLYSSLPFMAMGLGLACSSYVADFVMSRGLMTATAIRRTVQVTAFLGMSIFIVSAGFVTCDKRLMIMLLVCICTFFLALGDGAGYSCSSVDLAPQYASVIFAFSNTIASIPGMVAPVIVAVITVNGTSDEWRTVFYISAGCGVVGSLVYGSLSTAEKQPWAGPSTDLEFSVEVPAQIAEKQAFLEKEARTYNKAAQESAVDEGEALVKEDIVDQETLHIVPGDTKHEDD